MAMTPNCLFYASQSSLIVLCRGGVVVVNCEGGGLLVTGYDAPTLERRGQVVWLGEIFVSQKWKNQGESKLSSGAAGLHHPKKFPKNLKKSRRIKTGNWSSKPFLKKRHSTNVSL